MADDINFMNFGDDFVIRFGCEHYSIKAHTFANSLFEITSALEEINRIVDHESKINLYISEIKAGSFLTKLKILSDKVTSNPEFGMLIGLLVVALSNAGSLINIENLNINFTNNSSVIENNNQKFILPKPAGEHVEDVINSAKINSNLSQNFKILYDDGEVESFELEKSGDNKPIINFSRQDFILSKKAEVGLKTGKTRNAIESIKEIMIEVLNEAAQSSNGCLGAREIGRRSGLFTEGGYGITNFNDAQATGLLAELHKEGRVQKCTQKFGKSKGRGGWMLKQ